MVDVTERCRYETADSDVPADLGGVCCWRETWNAKDYCIWHAESTKKPISKLSLKPSDVPQRVDYLKLKRPVADEKLDLSGYTLWKASFESCILTEPDFSGAILHGSSFNGCQLN